MTDVRTMTTSELVIRICDSAIDYDRERMIYELDRRIPVPNVPKKLDGWQPIETAPRIGERVLAYGGVDKRVRICRLWMGGAWRTDEGDRVAVSAWMPLPEVPR